MNGVAAVQSAFAGAHNWFMGTVADVTAEQANTVPAGKAHPIGALMAHIVHSEDFLINMLIANQPPLWQRDGWAEKIGGAPLLDQGNADPRAYTADPALLTGYAQAVFANTDAVLAGMSEAGLDGELNLMAVGFPQNMPAGAFLTQLLLGNTYAHTGEISALKGTLDLKGYPF